jgi:hypothetical protein
VELLTPATWVGFSIISQLELLSFPSLSSADQNCFEAFAHSAEVIALTVPTGIVKKDRVSPVRNAFETARRYHRGQCLGGGLHPGHR